MTIELTSDATLAVYKFAQRLMRDPRTPADYSAVIDEHKDGVIDWIGRAKFEHKGAMR